MSLAVQMRRSSSTRECRYDSSWEGVTILKFNSLGVVTLRKEWIFLSLRAPKLVNIPCMKGHDCSKMEISLESRSGTMLRGWLLVLESLLVGGSPEGSSPRYSFVL